MILAELNWNIRFASDSSLLVDCDRAVSETLSRQVVELHSQIMELRAEHPKIILNLHPAYRGVLIDFEPHLMKPNDLVDRIKKRISVADPVGVIGKKVEVPVFYGGDDGPDLEEVAIHTGLSTEEVIGLHSSQTYLVGFLGFAPGFPYLLGLPETLACPRKKTPRLSVKRGSVAIGGHQTGIYPEDSPGGWQIIGRTNLRLFDLSNPEPVLLSPGDQISFKPLVRK